MTCILEIYSIHCHYEAYHISTRPAGKALPVVILHAHAGVSILMHWRRAAVFFTSCVVFYSHFLQHLSNINSIESFYIRIGIIRHSLFISGLGTEAVRA